MQMGEALIRGFLSSGVSVPNNISASVRNAERQRVLSMLGIQVFGSATDGGAAEIAASSDIIILGVGVVFICILPVHHCWLQVHSQLAYVGKDDHASLSCDAARKAAIGCG